MFAGILHLDLPNDIIVSIIFDTRFVGREFDGIESTAVSGGGGDCDIGILRSAWRSIGDLSSRLDGRLTLTVGLIVDGHSECDGL